MTRSLLGSLAAVMIFGVGAALAIERSLTLEIGDPERSKRRVPLVLDAVTDSRSGELLSPAELVARLAGERLVLVGESHTDVNFHDAQLRIIRGLHDAGRKVVVGLEMFPYTKQAQLGAWIAGEYSEEQFLEQAQWYDAWGYHWNYYRHIFVFARDQRLPMYGLNTPREVVAAVRKKGFEELTEEERAHMPPSIDTSSEEHFRLFQAFFDDEDEFHAAMSDEQWRAMFDAQCTWDAGFGHHALRALERHPAPETVMVVLVGSGHVAYDLGIQRQMAKWAEVATATVIPIPVRLEDDEEHITEVQASYADFVWGMPPATDPVYPSLGISTRSSGDLETRTIIYVAEGSVAERAGFQVGDVLLEVDGRPLPDKATFARLMAEKRWGDLAVITVHRGDLTLELQVAFRRVIEGGGS